MSSTVLTHGTYYYSGVELHHIVSNDDNYFPLGDYVRLRSEDESISDISINIFVTRSETVKYANEIYTIPEDEILLLDYVATFNERYLNSDTITIRDDAKGDLEVWLDHEDPYGYQFYHAVETVNGLETGTKGYLTMEPNGTLSAPPHIVEGNYEAVADKTLDDFIGEDEAKELALKEFTEKAEILDRIPEEELKLVEAKLVNDGGFMYWQVSFENENRLLTVSLRAENGDVKAVFTVEVLDDAHRRARERIDEHAAPQSAALELLAAASKVVALREGFEDFFKHRRKRSGVSEAVGQFHQRHFVFLHSRPEALCGKFFGLRKQKGSGRFECKYSPRASVFFKNAEAGASLEALSNEPCVDRKATGGFHAFARRLGKGVGKLRAGGGKFAGNFEDRDGSGGHERK